MSRKLEEWVASQGWQAHLQPLQGDASLRRYYRIVDLRRGNAIVVDSTALPEALAHYVDITKRLAASGVRVPKLLAYDLDLGFALLEDIGSRHLIDTLSTEGARRYDEAIEMIVRMQQADTEGLPPYDRSFLLEEMRLMPQWYLSQYLQISISPEEASQLESLFACIADEVLAQPQGYFVHRDFHARNIMIDKHDALVTIDFQDARVGALTYDLVSLLRDVYVRLEPSEVRRLALHFRDRCGIDVDDATFLRWFDFTALQRHIKILGIFARLALRDGKRRYLDDIPQTLAYIEEVGRRYVESEGVVSFLRKLD